MPADRAAAQQAANATAEQLSNRDLTGEQRAQVVAELRQDLALLDRIEQQSSRPGPFGAPHIGTDILNTGGAE